MQSQRNSRRLKRAAIATVVCGVAGFQSAGYATERVWSRDAPGNWSDPNNWFGLVVPNSEADSATFKNIITGSRTVTVDGTFTISRINFSGGRQYTLAGTGPNGLIFDGVGTADAVINMTGTGGQASHTISAPMQLNSTLELINTTSNSTLLLTGPISGTGGLWADGGARVQVSGNSTYTGATNVSQLGTTLTVNSANALGSAAGATNVFDSGTITFNAYGNEPLNISNNGWVTLQGPAGASYTAPITLSNSGFVNCWSSTTIASPVALSGGDGAINGATTVTSSFSGTGTLVLSGSSGQATNVNAPITHAGGVRVQDYTVNFNAANTFAGPLTVGGIANINQTQTVSQLVLPSGTVNVAAGKTLGVTSPVTITGSGTINGALGSSAPITINTGGQTATLTGLGDGYTGPITVNQGTLVAGAGGLGSTAGDTFIGSPTGATLRILAGATVNETIWLNNSAGSLSNGLYTGGLGFQEVLSIDKPAVVAGRVDLGNTGSYISGGTTLLELAGPITGAGSLTTSGNPVRITADLSTYTGITRVRDGTLYVVNNGRIAPTTAGVTIERYGTLNLDNTGTANLPDRLGDSIPITMRGGELQLAAPDIGACSETIGDVTAALGYSTLSVTPQRSPATLTLASLTRSPGATMSFGADGFNGKILITNPPVLHNGIIGGWACSGAFFQTYGTNGVVNVNPTNAEINSVGPATNLEITNDTLNTFGPPVLTADRTINTVSMFENMTVDLGGHTLTLDSGGLAAEINSHVTVKNGTLAAGAGSAGELFLYGPVRVEANIPSGALTVSGNPATVTLAGTNTYTGPTTINAGNVTIEQPQSLAPNNTVNVNGGVYQIGFTSATPAKLDHLVLRQDGTIASSSTKIDANSYDVERGKLYAPLSGNGPMTKTSDGEVILRTDNSAYSGHILIAAGQITLGDGFTSSPYSLGTGTTTVLPGGRLVLHNGTVRGHIVLAGGSAEGIGDDFADGLTVTSTSALTAGSTTISGPLSVAPGAALVATTSSGTISVTGNATINGSFSANAGLQVAPASGNSLTGSGSVGGAVTITGGGKLAPGNSPGKLEVSSASFGPAGSYLWEVNDAAGGAGTTWDVLNVDGTLTITSTAGSPFVLKLSSLTASNLPGLAADFDASDNYSWTLVSASQISGFASQLFSIDASGFANSLQGGHFSLSASSTALTLQFTAAPEPGSGILAGSLLLAAGRRARRRRQPRSGERM